jgi:hypothetical protein
MTSEYGGLGLILTWELDYECRIFLAFAWGRRMFRLV